MSDTAAAAGSLEFRRINRAMLIGGFVAFALLYCVQPLLPLLARQFALTPAQSSWALSITTLALALSLLLCGVLSDRLGRRPLMAGALLCAAACTLLAAFAHSFAQLLVLRALLGLALGGMAGVAMAYLSEEVANGSLGVSIGLYIASTALGGAAGRAFASLASEFHSWRLALALLGAAALVAAWEFWRSLPASRHFRPAAPGLGALLGGARGHLGDAGLPWLYGLGFLLMGVFVSLYNYIGYRLMGPPFALGEGALAALALLYLLGMFSSVWAGRTADRIGRRKVLWAAIGITLAGLLLTLSDVLAIIVFGMGLFNFGFFAAHSLASSWVGLRARAPQALASALYLFFYYLGSSVIGSLCGVLYRHGGWNAVVALLAAALALALAIAVRLQALAPLPALASGRTDARTDCSRVVSPAGCVDSK